MSGALLVAPPAHRYAFQAIGTAWSIRTARPVSVVVREQVADVIARYDATWSRFRSDSAVSRLAVGGSDDLGPTAGPVLSLLLRLAAATDGFVSPLLGRPLEHLGYDSVYRLAPRPGQLTPPPATVLHVDGDRVTLAEPALIDVGAAGKGQLVDLVVEVLTSAGHDSVLVDAGGDLRAIGAPVQVALEHPYDPSMAIGVTELRDGALCASAVTRRSWDSADGRGRLHHVLDGRTGAPVAEIAATWVTAPTALVADALATALFFLDVDAVLDEGLLHEDPLGAESSAEHPDDRVRRPAATGAVRMLTDGRATAAGDLTGALFR